MGGILEKLEGLEEGYLSKSKTTDDVNKQEEDRDIERDIEESDWIFRLPARLVENQESTDEKIKTVGGNSEGDRNKEEKSKSMNAMAEKANSVGEFLAAVLNDLKVPQFE